MLTQARLKELLRYDEVTGEFVWLKMLSGRARVGAVAGTLRADGYITISIDRRIHRAHRLAWLYVRGFMPTQVDHEDHVRHHNQFVNLKPATHATNAKNASRSVSSASGTTGVDIRRGRFRAQVQSACKKYTLGTFDTLAEATVARQAANKEFGFHENHGASSCNRTNKSKEINIMARTQSKIMSPAENKVVAQNTAKALKEATAALKAAASELKTHEKVVADVAKMVAKNAVAADKAATAIAKPMEKAVAFAEKAVEKSATKETKAALKEAKAALATHLKDTAAAAKAIDKEDKVTVKANADISKQLTKAVAVAQKAVDKISG